MAASGKRDNVDEVELKSVPLFERNNEKFRNDSSHRRTTSNSLEALYVATEKRAGYNFFTAQKTQRRQQQPQYCKAKLKDRPFNKTNVLGIVRFSHPQVNQ